MKLDATTYRNLPKITVTTDVPLFGNDTYRSSLTIANTGSDSLMVYPQDSNRADAYEILPGSAISITPPSLNPWIGYAKTTTTTALIIEA